MNPIASRPSVSMMPPMKLPPSKLQKFKQFKLYFGVDRQVFDFVSYVVVSINHVILNCIKAGIKRRFIVTFGITGIVKLARGLVQVHLTCFKIDRWGAFLCLRPKKKTRWW